MEEEDDAMLDLELDGDDDGDDVDEGNLLLEDSLFGSEVGDGDGETSAMASVPIKKARLIRGESMTEFLSQEMEAEAFAPESKQPHSQPMSPTSKPEGLAVGVDEAADVVTDDTDEQEPLGPSQSERALEVRSAPVLDDVGQRSQDIDEYLMEDDEIHSQEDDLERSDDEGKAMASSEKIESIGGIVSQEPDVCDEDIGVDLDSSKAVGRELDHRSDGEDCRKETSLEILGSSQSENGLSGLGGDVVMESNEEKETTFVTSEGEVCDDVESQSTTTTSSSSSSSSSSGQCVCITLAENGESFYCFAPPSDVGQSLVAGGCVDSEDREELVVFQDRLELYRSPLSAFMLALQQELSITNDIVLFAPDLELKFYTNLSFAEKLSLYDLAFLHSSLYSAGNLTLELSEESTNFLARYNELVSLSQNNDTDTEKDVLLGKRGHNCTSEHDDSAVADGVSRKRRRSETSA